MLSPVIGSERCKEHIKKKKKRTHKTWSLPAWNFIFTCDKRDKGKTPTCLNHVEVVSILFPLPSQAQMTSSSCNISIPISLLNWAINFSLLWDTADLCSKFSCDAFCVLHWGLWLGENMSIVSTDYKAGSCFSFYGPPPSITCLAWIWTIFINVS